MCDLRGNVLHTGQVLQLVRTDISKNMVDTLHFVAVLMNANTLEASLIVRHFRNKEIQKF